MRHMKPIRSPHLPLILAAALICAFVVPLTASQSDDEAYEIKMGNEAAAEIEKESKMLKDDVLQARLDKVAKEVVAVASSVDVPASYGNSRISKFEYTFKIIDDVEVNAFALPGGHVYVNKGLLEFVKSDHELAGVLAHELVHVSHHHMLALLREQSKMNNRIALVLLAALVGKMPSRDLGNIVMGAQLVQIARMSTYGQQAEADADATAVEYLARTPYNAVGILTFIERLSAKSDLWEDQAGIMATHPKTGERRATIIAKLTELKIPINRRQVTDFLKAMPKTTTVDGREVVEIVIGEKSLMKVAPGEDGQPALQRAQQIADRVNTLLDSSIQLRDVKTRDGEPVVLAREQPFLRITDNDADLSSATAPQVAKGAAEVLRSVIWKQMIDLAMIPPAKERK